MKDLPPGGSITGRREFSQVESTIEEALGALTEYYRNNSLRANPDASHSVSSTEQRVEHAAPVWASSTYADILDPDTNKACRAIT